jgi:hypothetical protein
MIIEAAFLLILIIYFISYGKIMLKLRGFDLRAHFQEATTE